TEIIEDTVNGVLVSPKNPQIIARAIIQLASKKKKSEEMGRRGRKEIEKRFNTDTYIAKMLNIYKKILDKRNLEKTR
ncbi:unnamed protein product, partial [marine sediment metagenome]